MSLLQGDRPFRCLTIYFLFVYCEAAAQNQTHADSLPSIKALHAIYQMRFGDFEKISSTIKKEEKDVFPLLEIFALRWKDVPVAYSASGKQYHELLLKEAAQLERESQSTPIISYYKICTYLFLSEYHFSLDESWSALKYAQKAYPLITEAFDKNYEQPEFQFIKGLYLYYIEFFRQKNLFYRAALAPLRSGNKIKGIALLKSSAKKISMAQVEAQIFEVHLLLHLENRPFETILSSKELATTYPQNLKFTELYADNLIRCKMYKEALPVVERLRSQKSLYYSNSGDFFRGVIEEEYFFDKQKAKDAYQRCASNDYRPTKAYQRFALQRLKKI